MSKFYFLKIQRVVRETEQAVSVYFELPPKLKEAFDFTPGQYVSLETQIEAQNVRRAYSISSTPEAAYLRVAFKKIANGVFSNFAYKHFKKGDIVKVFPPEGRFHLQTSSKYHIAFAAGSGITPILSILTHGLKTQSTFKFLLVYGNKTARDTLYLQELEQLKAKYPDRFFVHYLFSREDSTLGKFGRIDSAWVAFYLKAYPEFKNPLFYLCGPYKMQMVVQEKLSALNFKPSQIFSELFFNPSQSKESTQAMATQVRLKITLDGVTQTLPADREAPILETALQAQLEPPYSCRGGICSSCIAKLTSGTATMKTNQILTDADIDEGLILTCQAYPTSDALSVDYDSV